MTTFLHSINSRVVKDPVGIDHSVVTAGLRGCLGVSGVQETVASTEERSKPRSLIIFSTCPDNFLPNGTELTEMEVSETCHSTTKLGETSLFLQVVQGKGA